MKNEKQLSTKTLIRNAVSAFKNGYIGAEQALSAIDFAAKLGDTEAQALIEKCRKESTEVVLNGWEG